MNMICILKRLTIDKKYNKTIYKSFKKIDLSFIEDNKNKSSERSVDYNNFNSVINLIIVKLIEANKGFFSDIDFGLFIIKYASKSSELNPVVGKAKKYVVESVKKCLCFYEDYNKTDVQREQDA